MIMSFSLKGGNSVCKVEGRRRGLFVVIDSLNKFSNSLFVFDKEVRLNSETLFQNFMNGIILRL